MKIQQGVPIPHKHAGRPRLYMYEQMQVGDCATIESAYNTIWGSLKRFTSKPEFSEWKFVLQKHGEKKVRVWRTA